jgi:hypothetical protein
VLLLLSCCQVVFVAATKVDLPGRKVTEVEGRAWALAHNMPYFEVRPCSVLVNDPAAAITVIAAKFAASYLLSCSCRERGPILCLLPFYRVGCYVFSQRHSQQ